MQSLEYYYFSNQIHSTALITDVNGNIEDDADYYPWGGTLEFTSNLANHYWFSGKERDAETGLDYFGARYYGNVMGRFMTPDWGAKVEGIPYADYTDPQSLNLYGYVRDNPVTRIDPDGHSVMSIVLTIATTAVDVGAAITAGAVALSGGAAIAAGYSASVKISDAYVANQNDKMTMDAAASANTGILAHPVTTNIDTKNPASTSQAGTTNTTTAESRSFPQGVREKTAENANHKCEYCGAKTVPAKKTQKGQSPPGNEQHTDHYKPYSKGGTSGPENAVNSCRTCNLEKSNTSPEGTKWELPRMKPPTPPQPAQTGLGP